jgi:hypothetical protein
MRPEDLRPENFSAYPPEARALALREIAILRRLPLIYVPLLLRELIAYDWKFPAERFEIDGQFAYFHSLAPDQITPTMAAFSAIRLSPALEQIDWVNDPIQFSEKLSAWLWSSHQMDPFRAASIDFINAVHRAQPAPAPPIPRLAMAIAGEGVQVNAYPLFRKLRPHGVHFTNVNPRDARQAILSVLARRAAARPLDYAHWYIDGEIAHAPHPATVCVSYQRLLPVRNALIEKMVAVMTSGAGPELLRSELARMQPSDLGLEDNGSAGILSRFQLSLLTEGSGTQIFSTTFVQWASREALRRAQPLTLLARYTPRQRDAEIRPIGAEPPPVDPRASLIDADMGAYYTWINQQRLSGAPESLFLAWFEDHSEAIAIGPKLPRGASETAALSLGEILNQLT